MVPAMRVHLTESAGERSGAGPRAKESGVIAPRCEALGRQGSAGRGATRNERARRGVVGCDGRFGGGA